MNSSPEYPKWVCMNNCGRTFDADTKLKRCPNCVTPLVRWLHYERKM